MKLTPYLMFFNGTCREAFDFYAAALGGQFCALITYGDMPSAPDQPPLPEQAKSQIAHVNLLAGGASLMGGDSIMGCDGSEKIDGGNDTTVNIEVDSAEEAERVFAALSAGGNVQMPLSETSWSHRFGMFEDRYGKPWMVNFMKPSP
ncbi:MAG: VOC family protein [Thermomonas sp.]